MSGGSDVAEIPVLCGPTAAGKSGLAMCIAARVPSVIISADSRQIYRGFDIGTAKPTGEERARVAHRGLDVVAPTERFSAAAWAEMAAKWISEALGANLLPLVVGGTGLYLRALFEGLFREPALDPSSRRALSEVTEQMPVPELRRWVETLDPPRARLGRTQLLRSVEIALLSGRRLSELHAEGSGGPRRRWRPRYLLVDPGRPALAARIHARLDDMFDHGWIDEVEGLMRTVPEAAPAWQATGYATVRRLVAGETTRPRAHDEILIATRQYAKRQRTWFRHQLPADRTTPFDPSASDWPKRLARWLALGVGAERGA